MIWLIVAAALAGAESLSLDLVLIMIAGGAVAGSISALAGLPATLQVIVAIVGALALLLVVRPIAQRHLRGHGATLTGSEALVGTQAIVLSRVDAADGRVRLNGGEWSARAFDHTQVMEVGTRVQVMQISGATAVVWDSAPLKH